MENNKTKDQAQSGVKQPENLAQQIYPTATVDRGAGQSPDSLAVMTIDEITTEEAEKVATAIPKQEDYDKRIKFCKYWSIILGLCVVLVMIVLPFCLPASADLGVITGITFF